MFTCDAGLKRVSVGRTHRFTHNVEETGTTELHLEVVRGGTQPAHHATVMRIGTATLYLLQAPLDDFRGLIYIICVVMSGVFIRTFACVLVRHVAVYKLGETNFRGVNVSRGGRVSVYSSLPRFSEITAKWNSRYYYP